jgi:prepilin-type N-terminal cleavage/methylation domain-containing protein
MFTSRKGFTLVEVILVISAIGVMSSLSIPMYRNYEVRNDLDTATQHVIQGLSRAKLLSQAGAEDSEWGFFVPAGTLYKGLSYEVRDTASDEIYPMPSSISVSGTILEVSYSKLMGEPSQTGIIELVTIDGERRQISISISVEQIATNINDRVTICHQPGQVNQTMDIPDNAWPGHQGHGDTLGPCQGAEGSTGSSGSAASAASSAASSVASSAASSAASSEAGGGGAGGPSCTDRFVVLGDNTIQTWGTVTMKVTALGSQITYGVGGPRIPVTMDYTLKNNKQWNDLFNNAQMTGGLVTTVDSISSGSLIALRFNGYYRKTGWLTFDETFATNGNDGHSIWLEDGDAVPSNLAFGSQVKLQTLLQPYMDGTNHLDIGPFDLVMIGELGNVTSPPNSAMDYQDAVALVQFTNVVCN